MSLSWIEVVMNGLRLVPDSMSAGRWAKLTPSIDIRGKGDVNYDIKISVRKTK